MQCVNQSKDEGHQIGTYRRYYPHAEINRPNLTGNYRGLGVRKAVSRPSGLGKIHCAQTNIPVLRQSYLP
ncbi:hypothetical protein AFLA_002731 [Aspergillus flavus NRRL3357]|nr:hypothetical protein AFLA_002731 [Aspergillus flavus NRRL3357]